MVPFANEKIDKDGRVTDAKKREKIRELLESLVVWTKRMRLEDGTSPGREEREAA